MNKYMPLIQNSPLISTLGNDEIEAHLKNGRFQIKSYAKDSIIHLEGESCKKSEIILRGRIHVDRIDQYGNLLNVTALYRGDLLGSNLLFSNHPFYPMTITAQEDTVILEMEKELLIDLCYNNKNFLVKYLELISANAFHLGRTIKHNVNRSIRQRMISFLKHEYQRQSSLHIRLDISKKALAEKFGVQRTSLSRELKKMKEEGFIDFDHRSIRILDKKILMD